MLEFLDVRHNHFNDSFPFWLGSLPKLYGSFFIDLSSFSLFNKGVVMDYLGGQYLCGHEVPAWKLKQCWHGLKYLCGEIISMFDRASTLTEGLIRDTGHAGRPA
ncbi:uncharacterized protein DS421_15g508460 [Arachis hypogaea]|nr:uncharacterized protein DS421_15g508460 [Arachis hypogaea]